MDGGISSPQPPDDAEQILSDESLEVNQCDHIPESLKLG